MTKNKIVVVHGVQTGDDNDAEKGPRRLLEELGALVGTSRKFDGFTPSYESFNDSHTENMRDISKWILKAIGSPLGSVISPLIDLVGDVFIYKNSEKAKQIRAIIGQSIDEAIGSENGCILVGHSLGSVVCFDILMEYIKNGDFANKNREEWPIKAMITFGSPLSIPMFKRNRNLELFNGSQPFHWYNYSDREDPVVSGNIFGSEFTSNQLMRDVYAHPDNSVHIHDRQVDTGFHLLAHINYWQQQHIILRLASLLE